MTCREYRELIAAHVDGVLAPDEARRAVEHLRACEACGLLYRSAEVFRRELRGRMRPLKTPEALRADIVTRLAAERRPRAWGRRRPLRPLVVGSVAALLALALGGVLAPHQALPRTIAADVVAAERGRLALPARSVAPAALARFFAEVGVPDRTGRVLGLEKRGWRLIGAGRNRWGGTVTVYRRGKEILVCHRIRLRGSFRLPRGAVSRHGLIFYSIDGVTLCLSREGDVLCCLASRMPRARFIREVVGAPA